MIKHTFNTKIGNQMQNLYCRNVRNVKFPKIVAEKFAFYNWTEAQEIGDSIISTIELKKVINPLDDKETFQKAAKALME